MFLTRDLSNPLGKRGKRVLKVGGQVLGKGVISLPSPAGVKRKNNINFNPKVARIKPSTL